MEDDFVSEVCAAPAVVAVAVRVTAAPSMHRRLIATAAVALGVVAIVGVFGFAAMTRPATPATRETRVFLTHQASLAPPSPSPFARPQSLEESATLAVPATPAASIAAASVSGASEGQLRVISSPSGGRVTINGIGWGQTPLTIQHLPLGMKTVRVTREGYTSQERRVDLRSDRPAATLQVTLTSEAGN